MHYRRGDKVKKLCDAPDNQMKYTNCKPMKEFIIEMRKHTNESLYIATDEHAEDQLDVLRSSDNIFSKITTHDAGINLNSIERLIFELQLMISAEKLYIVKDASTLGDFLVLARRYHKTKGRRSVVQIR